MYLIWRTREKNCETILQLPRQNCGNIKQNKLGRKFRRQYGIEHYITDFCCPKEKLVIELDGQVHNNVIQGGLDEERDARLKELGYTTLRFENKDVFDNIDWVLAEIKSHFKK